jgi:methylated-DNA-[protein]-cysteine S-methyltransferase
VESRGKKIRSNPCIAKAAKEIAEYFEQGRREFTCEISLAGTSFQLRVWQQLLNVTYGRTASYKDIAIAVGNPKGVRAVGAANGKNPISLIVPCHRIIGSNGKLTGYGGGLWRKEWLLRHEGCLPQ